MCAPKRLLTLILTVFALLGAQSAVAQAKDEEIRHPALPYTYPFDTAGMAGKLAGTPVFIELFTSIDCLFCPRAERLIADMVQKTKIIALACHTDPEGPDYPLARGFCLDRQERYSGRLTDGLLYTPQMVMNGQIDAVGHEFEDVTVGLQTALSKPPTVLAPRATTETGIYMVDLPALSDGAGADVMMFTYRPPYTVPKTMRQSTTRPDPLVRIANGITPLGGWDGRAKTVTLSFTPNPETAGFVVIVQKQDGAVLAVGQGPNAP